MDIKELINKYPRINFQSIKRQIDQHEIISFDMFDTLIKRDVKKEYDVFDLTEQLFNYNSNYKISGYREIRKKAEEKARLYSDEEEITIVQIGKALVSEIDATGLYITESIAESLIKYESEVEKGICTRNELLYPLYEYCLNTKKRIIITSDMYWGKEFLEEILICNGIKNYDAIYVSSEYGKQKKTGSLYQLVINKENVYAETILHIGDNKIGDYLVAKKVGLKAVSIPKLIDNTSYGKKVEKSSLEWRCCESFINNRLSDIDSINCRIGYEVYGPLLYSFVRWLAEKLDKSKTTLFFARDCYVVKSAFELYSEEQSDKNIYFLGSRRSIVVPALKNGADLDKVSVLIKSEARKMTISGLLNKLGVDSKEYAERLRDYNLSGETILDRDNLCDNENFVSFYESIKSDIVSNAEEEYKAFCKYWSTLNCTHDIQIVDIGWRGTMQYCLETLLGNNYAIKGYYIGIRKDAVISNYEDIFLNGREDFDKECFLASMTALIEIFFSAPHGSVKRYSDECGVEYLPYECENDFGSRNLVMDIQEGALRFVKDYKKSVLSELIPIQSESMFTNIIKMGTEPQVSELRSFGSYPFQMGVGVKKTIDSKGVLKYSISPKSFLYDFSSSNWKVGFLKETMRIKMPYYPLFKWIYKHRG